MRVGVKAQGREHGKAWVRRHGSRFSKASARRCEKALETKVRRGARREIAGQRE